MNRRLLPLAAVSYLAIAACGTVRHSEPLRGPLHHSPVVARGHVVFDQHCRRCHSEGEGGLGPSLNDKHAPPFLIKFQVRKGLGAMPAFNECEISDRDLDALVCYMLARRNH